MSATHIAYGSIRMEPVYMIMGQACGTAAGIAIDDQVDVQKVAYPKLRERLVADKQLIEWKGGANAGAGGGGNVKASSLAGVVVDDTKAKLTGDWVKGSFGGIEQGYLHDQNDGKGQKSARFEITAPAAGRYDVRLAYTPNPNRATNVPVTVETVAAGKRKLTIDQKKPPTFDGHFVSLGVYTLAAGEVVGVTVSNEGTSGFVIVDAVQVVPAKD
jgi:hypothetical protein